MMIKLQRGFTIIELTIYIALMSVLLLVISRIFISSLEIQTESESVSYVEQDGRYVLSRLMYDILQADSITTPAAPGDTSDSLILVRNGTTYLYSVSGNRLELSDSVSGERLNSPGTLVSDLSFQRIGNLDGKHTIQFTFTLTSSHEDEVTRETRTFQTTVGER